MARLLPAALAHESVHSHRLNPDLVEPNTENIIRPDL